MRISLIFLALGLAACSNDSAPSISEPAAPTGSPIVLPNDARPSNTSTSIAVVIPSSARQMCGGGSITIGNQIFDVRATDTGPNATPYSGCQVAYDSATKTVYLTISCDSRSRCTGAGMVSRALMSYGVMETEITGPANQLAPSVTLGAFTYPQPVTPSEVVDGTREIDVVEWAQWGSAQSGSLNFTVWPNALGLAHKSCQGTLPAVPSANRTFTSRAMRQPTGVYFETFAGTSVLNIGRVANASRRDWRYVPKNSSLIPQRPSPFHFNLWRFGTGNDVKNYSATVAISGFRYTPAIATLPNASASMC